MGKSRLVAQIATKLIMGGIGTSILDPANDLADDILALLYEQRYFEKHGYDKLWYIDFSRTDRYTPFNILNQADNTYAIARNFVEVCSRAWSSLADGAAPLFENIILNSLPVLIESNLPLTALDTFLTNKVYREHLLTNCSDPQIVSFFHDRFDKWGRDAPLLINSTLNRAMLLTYPPLRNILGQQENILDFRKIMDEGISVIYNLGNLDQQTQKILGCLLMVGMENAALSRSNIPQSERTPHQLMVDEFPMFASSTSESLSRMLSLVRKFNLTLTLINQTWAQSEKKLQGAMGNCLPLYFRLGYDDASYASKRIGGFDPLQIKEASATEKELAGFASHMEQFEVMTQDITNLNKREFYWNGMKAKTVDVQINPAYRERIEHLKDYYSLKLLKPIEQIEVTPKIEAIPSIRKRKL